MKRDAVFATLPGFGMRRRAILTALAAGLALEGCAAEAPPKARTLEIALHAGWVVNPDLDGRASPIVLRVYQLKSDDTYMTADFYALYDHDAKVLGDAVLAREEVHLMPGENRTIVRTVSSGATRLAVWAGFQDVERAQWRAVANLESSPAAARAVVGIDGTAVSVSLQ